MPYNILFKTKNEFVKYEMKYNIKYIDYMCKNLNNKKAYKVSMLSKLVCFIFKIQRLGCTINSSKYKVDKEKCIRCRKCINSCPTRNISYNRELKRIVFSDKCIMCMRCSFYCPSDAISIGIINKYKVNGSYDMVNILNEPIDYDFSLEKEKFYKKFRKYFEYIDSLTSN